MNNNKSIYDYFDNISLIARGHQISCTLIYSQYFDESFQNYDNDHRKRYLVEKKRINKLFSNVFL